MDEMRETKWEPDRDTPTVPADPADARNNEDFTEQEFERLLFARYRFERSSLTEWPGDERRLRFARWLYQTGKISG